MGGSTLFVVVSCFGLVGGMFWGKLFVVHVNLELYF